MIFFFSCKCHVFRTWEKPVLRFACVSRLSGGLTISFAFSCFNLCLSLCVGISGPSLLPPIYFAALIIVSNLLRFKCHSVFYFLSQQQSLENLKIKGAFQAWAIDVLVGIISRSAAATFCCGWTLKAIPNRNTWAHSLLVWAFLLPIRCITNLLLMGPLCIQQEYFWSSPGSHNICWVHA